MKLDIKTIRERFCKWVENHPDVWHEDGYKTSHFWWVQNCVGDIIRWVETPSDWLESKEGGDK